MGDVILILIMPTETNLIYMIMNQFMKDVVQSLKRLNKTNLNRLKLLLIILLIVACLGLGGYGLYFSIQQSGAMIILFIVTTMKFLI